MLNFVKKICVLSVLIISTQPIFAQKKLIKVGAFNHYPAIFKDSDGIVKGIYVDLLAEIEKQEEVQFEYKYGTWFECLERLKHNEIDILPSVAFTEERANYLQFGTEPLFTVWGAVYVRSNSNLKGVNSFSGKTIAVMKGDYNAEFFEKHLKQFGVPFKKKEYNSFDEIFFAVQNYEADIAVVNNLYGNAMYSNYDLRLSDVVFNPFDIFFATSINGDANTLKMLDGYLTEWKNKRLSPYNKARIKWSHGDIGKVEVTPSWVWILIYSIIILVVIISLYLFFIKSKFESVSKLVLKKQADLDNQENTFKSYIDNSPVGIYVINKHGIIKSVNNAYEKMVGYTAKELIGTNIFEYQSEDRITEDKKYFKEFIEVGKVNYETRTVSKGGNIQWFHLQGIRLEENTLLVFATDIEFRKNMEERIYAAYDMLSLVMNNIPQYVFWKDKNSVYLGANKHFAKSAGFEKSEDLIGKTDFECAWSKEIAAQFIKEDQEVMGLDEPKYRIIKKQKNIKGEDMWIETNKIPLHNSKGKVVGVLGTYQDITESVKSKDELIKAKEKAEESDKLKTAFLHNMSHEIRTPMNAIMGFADILPDYFGEKELLEKYTQIISGRGQDLLEIIDDILHIARIESGQLTVSEAQTTIKTVFSDIQDFFDGYKKRVMKPNVFLKINQNSPSYSFPVSLDAGKLKQILINLISNAFKFSREGNIEVGAVINKNDIMFYISDNGIGIPIEKQQAIFNRFTQVESMTDPTISGTGLGLSIVKGLLDMLGGKVWLESVEGEGTTFYFTIPYTASEVTIINETQIHVDTSKLLQKHILLVEDDEHNIEYIFEVLSKHFQTINVAKSGGEVITCLENNTYDVVLLDLRLPDVSGLDLVPQIKKHNAQTKIIAQTAFATSADKQNAFDAGCDDFVTKPIQHKRIIEKIALLL